MAFITEPPAPHSPLILAEPDTSPGPFEGPEKLLEVWFAPCPDALPSPATSPINGASTSQHQREGVAPDGKPFLGLRNVPRAVWEEMLDIVKCKVLSVVEGDEIDAYCLSESSMFVAPHVLILKTCGTTLNLYGLHRIIDIARRYCGLTTVWRCFYSRKSFFFPELQQGPHRDWKEEVTFLDKLFGATGSAYTVGPINRDHWLLYLTAPNQKALRAVDGPERPLALPCPRAAKGDQTLEILMSHLSNEGRAPFFVPEGLEGTSGHKLGADISRRLGIDQLFPQHETVLDAFGFEPCGYSSNAVIGTGMSATGNDGGYFTIHVTPEEGWSYASFECNVPLPDKDETAQGGRPDLRSLVRRVVDIFQPNRLSITLFVSTERDHETTHQDAWSAIGGDLVGEFDRKDRIGYEFDGYDLVFGCYERRGWAEPPSPIVASKATFP
ncbi:S-adenosylmethionine decarboxylase proenzyme [Vanrija pseudolonga]|uniref:S-adenosylmethionine decarboxylase proenzyme n=1 Tax=Vanrija pseudolonga TaxID=143232 RepID=A0AAF0YK88_9TREE|nr:S-adenosylmethionine decarboxylase proenzyme [Vanrija pseudolonga]